MSYNINDYQPQTGKEINSAGNVVNPADSVDSSGNQGIAVNKRNQNTIQTHTGVSVAANGNNMQTNWMDCNGFDKIAVTLLNDASASCSADVYWSNDGVNIHGSTPNVIASGVKTYASGITDLQARYAKVRLNNGDTTNPHIMNAWAFLKD